MNTRIKKLRNALGLTQTEFGERIGFSRPMVANLEGAGRAEVKDHAIHLICKEYNVNEEWLRNGTGEMFVEMSRDEELAEFFGKIQCSDDDSFPRQFMEVLKELDEDEWEVLAKMAVKLANKIKRD